MPPPPAQAMNDSQEVTAIDSKILGDQPFNIESSKKNREEDDDPTMLHVRDDIKPSVMKGAKGPVLPTEKVSKINDTTPDGPRIGESVASRKTPKWIWFAIAGVIVAVGVVAALYFLGYIK